MARILLIRPPSSLEHLMAASHAHLPLNLLYFISHLEAKSHKTDLLDYEISSFDINGFKRKIKKIKYDLVGISSMTATVKFANYLAGIVKSVNPKTVTILGGPHADGNPLETKKEFRNFDLVAFGEGENTLLEVADKGLENKDWSKIDGIAYENRGKIRVNKPRALISDINTIPYPAYERIDFSKYKGAVSPGIFTDNAAEMIISRGCPYRCSFCAIHNTFGYKTRFRTAENIIKEVELLKKYGIKHIFFVDSTFTLNRKLCFQLFSYLKKTKVSWNCATRVNCVDPQLLKAMKDAGCIKISYGVEAGSPRVRSLIHKNITNRQIIDAFKWTRKLNILTCALFIIAADPSETPKETKMSWKLSRKIKPDFLAFSIITPYPGTEVYEKMKRKRYLKKKNWEGYCHHDPKITWRTDYYNPSDLIRIKKSFDRKHYLSLHFITKVLMSLKSFKDFWYYVKSARAMFSIGKNQRQKRLLRRYQPYVSTFEFKLLRKRFDLVPVIALSEAIPLKCSIFELGCGRGVLANFLAEISQERQVVGIDLSGPRVKLARKAAKDLSNVSYYVGNVMRFNKLKIKGRIKPRVFILSQILYLLSPGQASKLLCRISSLMNKEDSFWIIDYTTKPFWKYLFLRLENMVLFSLVTVAGIIEPRWKVPKKIAVRLFGERRRLARIPTPTNWYFLLHKAGLEYADPGFRQSGPEPQIVIYGRKRR